MSPQQIDKIRAEIKNYLHDLLDLLEEEEATLEVEADAPDDIYANVTGTVFNMPDERPVLRALEYLLRIHLKHKTGSDCNVVVDINGTIKKRRAALIRFALTTAESVRKDHKRVRLNPMPPPDRRTVHVALASFPGVKTYSVGKRAQRRVVIEPEDV